MWNVENMYLEFLNVMSKQTYPRNHSSWIKQYETVVEEIRELLNKKLGDKNSQIPLSDEGKISVSCDSWELVSDDDDDENFDRTDSLVL